MTWRVGDRVRSIPSLAHLCNGTVWQEYLSQQIGGTVIEVPLDTQSSEDGMLLVDWDSMTGEKGDTIILQRWMHSKHIEKVD